MKPDKKKELPTEEYQRPPLLEEIKFLTSCYFLLV